ncbi:MAG: hypothetical protein AAF380_01100 [Bacteroidota bacterium]
MKKQRFIITMKEENMSQVDSLARFLNEKGVEDIKILSNIGLIIGRMDGQIMQVVADHPAVERVAEDKQVHML